MLKKRPAEVTTVAGAAAYLILYLLDAMDNPTVLVALAMLIGAIPSVVTWLVVTIRGDGKPKGRKARPPR